MSISIGMFAALDGRNLLIADAAFGPGISMCSSKFVCRPTCPLAVIANLVCHPVACQSLVGYFDSPLVRRLAFPLAMSFAC